ncbi:hypothetical protein MTP99_008526 [Tenebrio molitor]|nr:hypothetical protein MTP99_008526 [Tenebrio molitor]CAH1367277.1 unnamed protein product [Tenebrio molitor]
MFILDPYQEKGFFCKKCGKSYTLRRNLQRHEKVECQKEKKFVCGICSHRTYYKSDLRVHIFNKHGVQHQRVECGQEKKLRCHVCDHKFYYKQELIGHMHIKHNLLPLTKPMF